MEHHISLERGVLRGLRDHARRRTVAERPSELRAREQVAAGRARGALAVEERERDAARLVLEPRSPPRCIAIGLAVFA